MKEAVLVSTTAETVQVVISNF